MKFVDLGFDVAYFCRLDYDSDLVSELREFVIKNRINSGFFTVIGAVKGAVLSFYSQEGKKYVEEAFNEPLEVVSCTGNVFLRDNAPFVHAHACLSRKDGSVVAGHLVSAKVFAGEVFFFAFKDKLKRKFDEKTGLWLVDFE